MKQIILIMLIIMLYANTEKWQALSVEEKNEVSIHIGEMYSKEHPTCSKAILIITPLEDGTSSFDINCIEWGI